MMFILFGHRFESLRPNFFLETMHGFIKETLYFIGFLDEK
jgi:hypothetical protein